MGKDLALVVVSSGSGMSRDRVEKQYRLCRGPPDLMEVEKEAGFWSWGLTYNTEELELYPVVGGVILKGILIWRVI